MNKENRNNLTAAGYILTKKLGFKPENIMVTGSIALDLLGVLSKDAHDVDFIIKMSDEEWRMLKLYSIINNGKNSYDNNAVMFNLYGITFNIFREHNLERTEIKDNITDFWIADVKNIIKVKKQYGRRKDYEDLYNISVAILNP